MPQSFKQNAGAKSKQQRTKRNRNLNAYAIATAQDPDASKVRKHRLGELDVDDEDRHHKKKQRVSRDEDDEGEGEEDGAEQRSTKPREYDGLDADGGSDSEGNEWHFGFDRDAGDEDEDIDSDEAFGESDEERFEDYTFRGSSKLKHPSRRQQDAGPGDESDDSFGSEGVDLATMLDDPESEDEVDSKPVKSAAKKSRPSTASDDDSMDVSSDEEEDASAGNESESLFDDEDDVNPAKLAQMRRMVESMEKAEQASDDDDDGMADLKPGALLEAMKQVASGNKKLSRAEKKSQKNDGALAAPLPKRQQDRLDREAAYEKARETLGRWQATVKHNREADHLMFPLPGPRGEEAAGTKRMLPTPSAKPGNALESAIEGILQDSGLSSSKGKAKDDMAGDELPDHKPSLKDVEARRAELRHARELLFREEQRAKRVKKIKSKAYRRVHRKEREKHAEQLRDAEGSDASEGELEQRDRRRAEERMSTRHRDSKWAKAAKKTGQLTWNAEARSGVEQMARRNEELRRRVAGENDGPEPSDDESFGDSDENDEDFALRTNEALAALRDEPDESNKTHQRLAGLKFMQRIDAAEKERNEADRRDLEKMLRRNQRGSDESDSSSEEERPVGRRSYGPSVAAASTKKSAKRNEFEEGPPSDEEAAFEDEESAPSKPASDEWTTATSKRKQKQQPEAAAAASSKKDKQKPTVKSAERPLNSKQEHSEHILAAFPADDALPSAPSEATPPEPSPSGASKPSAKVTSRPSKQKKPQSKYLEDDPSSSDVDASDANPNTEQSNAAHIAAAFAPDTTALNASFASEKKAATSAEDTQTASTSLPGWGAWAGAGLTKAARKSASKAAQRAPHKTTQHGVAASQRRDAHLDKVVLSERRPGRKQAALRVGALPFPFESAAQYEAGLRVPLGREWQAQGAFEESVKPRVLMKGGVVRAMERPMG